MKFDIKQLLLASVILAIFLGTPLAVRAGLTLSIQPDTTQVDINCEFEIKVHAGPDTLDFMGYDVRLLFDPEYLEITGCSEGELPSGSGEETFFYWQIEPSCDIMSVSGAILGAEIETPGDLLSISFKALKSGTTNIGITYSDLRDGNNDGIGHDAKGGEVSIITEIGAENTSWGRLKSSYIK
ncbi:MAG: cohesin domain-containing protein [Candidatus Krumholzibacteriota bacterium]|nr:cohesin domain-containing protein [Candidatus Krumholzibacteriota bacterium]